MQTLTWERSGRGSGYPPHPQVTIRGEFTSLAVLYRGTCERDSTAYKMSTPGAISECPGEWRALGPPNTR